MMYNMYCNLFNYYYYYMNSLQARRLLRKNGHFLFTVESVTPDECVEGREFRLLKSGRFGYSSQYIDAVATKSGFNVTV